MLMVVTVLLSVLAAFLTPHDPNRVVEAPNWTSETTNQNINIDNAAPPHRPSGAISNQEIF